VVLSSPSGVGKTTLAERLLALRSDVGRSISATTRSPRAGEVDGRDYFFLSPEEFERRENAGEFLESASYGGKRYGTLRAEVERLLTAGRHVLLVIEVAGARQVRARFPEAALVFVLPPSGEALVSRLSARRTEAPEALRRRLGIANEELREVGSYDYVVVNDDLEDAVRDLGAILDAESRRVNRQHELVERVEAIRRDVAAAAAGLGK
jgi:guanylate kinase